MTLLDLLTVWESPMIEMEQFGLFILLAYAGQEDPDVSTQTFDLINGFLVELKHHPLLLFTCCNCISQDKV